MTSPIVQITTVTAYAVTVDAHAVAPKPSAMKTLLTARTCDEGKACSHRVSGTVTKTMSSTVERDHAAVLRGAQPVVAHLDRQRGQVLHEHQRRTGT